MQASLHREICWVVRGRLRSSAKFQSLCSVLALNDRLGALLCRSLKLPANQRADSIVTKKQKAPKNASSS